MNEPRNNRPATDDEIAAHYARARAEEELTRARNRAQNILFRIAARIADGEDPRDETTDEPWGYHVGATLADIATNELENIADARRALDTHR